MHIRCSSRPMSGSIKVVTGVRDLELQTTRCYRCCCNSDCLGLQPNVVSIGNNLKKTTTTMFSYYWKEERYDYYIERRIEDSNKSTLVILMPDVVISLFRAFKASCSKSLFQMQSYPQWAGIPMHSKVTIWLRWQVKSRFILEGVVSNIDLSVVWGYSSTNWVPWVVALEISFSSYICGNVFPQL